MVDGRRDKLSGGVTEERLVVRIRSDSNGFRTWLTGTKICSRRSSDSPFGDFDSKISTRRYRPPSWTEKLECSWIAIS
jgi:hypothetical protein